MYTVDKHKLNFNCFLNLFSSECSFVSKALYAESIGAQAVIIMDHDKNNIESMIDMVQDETDREVHIPAFFLQGRDG